IATLNNTGSINGNINLTDVSGNGIGTLNNSGTITGKITLNGGKLDASSVATINTLTNYETGSIGEILVGGNSGGHIGTLNNYGTITNGITIANGSGSIVNLNNYSTLGNVDTGKVGLTNNNTIDNLRNYETGSIVYAGTGTIDKLLDNKGTIALANSANSISLNNGVRVNNSGVITGSQNGSGAILLASGGAAISINNTGLVNVKNYKQSQIGVDGADASVNIESWKLTLNESTSTFNNTPGYTYRVSDERYLSGTFIPAEVTPPTDGSGGDTGSGADVATPKGKWVFTTIGSGANTDSNKMNANSHIYVSTSNEGKFENVNFLNNSIVLDLSTQGFEIGQVYNMDNLVYGVDNNGLLTGIGSAEWTIKDNGSGNGTLVYELDSGASSVNGGRGLTSANLAIQDDLYTISDTFIDTITSENGDGKRVRGFSIGVDVANGAGAILAQGLTNVSARRSLFIDSITTTAIQATIDQTSRTQQVSYNDSDVNFENLAKYAQISTDAYSATSNRDTYFYAIPYYTADSMDLQGGFENLKGNTYGLVAGAQKNLYDAGIVGIFFGFESGSYDTSARFTSYNQDDLTFYGGLNYYKVLGGTESREYYVKAIAKAALISSDVSRSTTAGSGTGDASVDSANFGAGADLGINFYLTDAHVISPEIGISYDRLNTDSFVIGNQYYEESDANLLQGKIGFNWLAQWSPVFSTNFGAGIKNNFTGDIDTAVRIDNNHISQTVDLPSTYQYVQGGLSYMITNNVEVSLNYNGNYSSDTSSHSGLLRLGMWW
ncbi:autotransporter outer membrane beta-barrel domain-containing protein, partial [Helicobacter sp. WB40]|uniref:autotransporter outer membrane beta-barrel domain-containing protein n=1 Tax=Helicobacter sp. WB40 TaxID=3004130 RepID=UPI0022EBA57B